MYILPGIWSLTYGKDCSLIIFVWSGLVAGLVRLEHVLYINKVVWFPVLICLFSDSCCYMYVSLSDLHLCCSIIVWAPKDTLGEGEGSWQQTEATSTRCLDCLNPDFFFDPVPFFYRVHTEPWQENLRPYRNAVVERSD